MQKNLKTIGAYTESNDLIFKAFQKIIHLVALSLQRGLPARLDLPESGTNYKWIGQSKDMSCYKFLIF
jgi:hypothetical protein